MRRRLSRAEVKAIYDARAEAAQLAAAMRTDPDGGEAAATDIYRRAYLGHGDQLGALEAEAAAHARRRRRALTTWAWRRLLDLHDPRPRGRGTRTEDP